MADEYTVEAALTELREMFPDRQLIVDVMVPEYGNKKSYGIQVGANGYDFKGPTLQRCMAQVKKWRESQS